MSGMVLKFDGAVTGDGLDVMGGCKTFPAGVYYFLIEGWKDKLAESSADPTLAAFLESKGASEVHAAFVKEISSKGKAMMSNAMTGYYSSGKIKPMLKDKFIAAYKEKGIDAVLSKITVNLGMPAYREFLWVELIDASAAGGYKPGQAMSM